MNWPWNALGLPGPADLAAVRRAYAGRLKTTHPEEDPEGFQRLHEAYQEARRLARKAGGTAPAPENRAASPEQERPKEPSEEPSEGAEPWDYDRIFAQEAQRRAEERERNTQARRAAFFARYQPSEPEEARRLGQRWARIEAALTIVEELSDSHAPLQDWVAFFHSGVFFSVKGDEDFVAGLEEFLRRTPDLEGEVKQELIQTFGLWKRSVPPEWQGLQTLLTGVTPPPPPQPREKKPIWKRWTAWAALLVVLIPFFLYGIGYLRSIPGRQERAQMCQYLEEDLGRKMESRWDGTNYGNVYAPWDQPGLTFQAWPEGERNLAAGQRGYTTNYGNVMFTEALKEFAQQSGYELKEIEEGGVKGIYGSSPGAYLLKVSLWGEEEGLTALGELLSSLEEANWYQVCPPVYQLHLAVMNFAWYTYTPDTPFDIESLLHYYQTAAGTDLCAYLVEKSGLAEADFPGAAYRLEAQGVVELPDRRMFLVSGVDASGETVRQYLFDGWREVFSVPAEDYRTDKESFRLRGDTFQSDWADKPIQLNLMRK